MIYQNQLTWNQKDFQLEIKKEFHLLQNLGNATEELMEACKQLKNKRVSFLENEKESLLEQHARKPLNTFLGALKEVELFLEKPIQN